MAEFLTLSNLSPKPGSRRPKKRVGRGSSSGHGKTSGRGQKGQKSRAGHNIPVGFEGGQMPIYRRLPKRGFHNRFRKQYLCLNVGWFERFDDGAEISYEMLVGQRLVRRKAKHGLKLLGGGELSKKLTFKVAATTASARKKIEAAGGTVVLVGATEEEGRTGKS